MHHNHKVLLNPAGSFIDQFSIFPSTYIYIYVYACIYIYIYDYIELYIYILEIIQMVTMLQGFFFASTPMIPMVFNEGHQR